MDPGEARHRLEDERARLEHLRAGFAGDRLDRDGVDDSSGELSHVDQHLADSASDTFEREKDLSILEQVEAELDDVERALRRLDQGTYGTCEACGEPVGDERLDAMPAARFCVRHQHLAELRSGRLS